MDVMNKIRFLINKQTGLGIPMQVIARYCGCHPSGISNYLHSNVTPPEEALRKYENGINKIIADFKNNIIED